MVGALITGRLLHWWRFCLVCYSVSRHLYNVERTSSKTSKTPQFSWWHSGFSSVRTFSVYCSTWRRSIRLSIAYPASRRFGHQTQTDICFWAAPHDPALQPTPRRTSSYHWACLPFAAMKSGADAPPLSWYPRQTLDLVNSHGRWVASTWRRLRCSEIYCPLCVAGFSLVEY